jgi:hypothetical protein
MSRLTVVLLVVSLFVAESVSAQEPERVVVTVTAPVFLKPDATATPFRLAKEGSALRVVTSERDWYRIEFEDPQFGRSLGYIQKRHVKAVPPPASSQLQPVDLSVAEARPKPPAPQAQIPPSSLLQQQPVSAPPSQNYSFYPSLETGIGWSILRDSLLGDVGLDATSFVGWNTSFAGNLTPWMGLVGDVGGNYKNVLGVNLRLHTFLGGVRVTGRSEFGRINPFGQVLAGLVQSSASYSGLGISSGNDFAIQPGGGVDIGLSDSIAVRMQFDYRTIFDEGERFNEIRFMPGIVIRTGSKAF